MNSSTFSGLLRCIAILSTIVTLTSCGTQQSRHSSKINLIAKAGNQTKKSQTLATALYQADIALQSGIKTPEQKAAYNQALEDVVTLWMAQEKDQHLHSLLTSNATTQYQLLASWPKTLKFDTLTLARTVKKTNLRNDIYRDGVGVPYVANWEHTPEREKTNPFMTSKGYFASITATLDFKKNRQGIRQANLVLHNSNITERVNLHNHSYPLAFDQSALIEHILSMKADYSALSALMRPYKYIDYTGIKSISPPNPDLAPVIFVHGLASDPRTWQNVYNELRADPTIRKKYQIYFFRYPSGVPVLYSAAKFREQLTLLQKQLNKKGRNRANHQMLVIGHSMGGLVTKSQVQNSTDKLWITFKKQKLTSALLNDQQLSRLKTYLEFQPNPNISRVLFISTPHRGSDLADLWIVRQLKKLIKAPFAIIGAPINIIDKKSSDDVLTKLYQSGIPTSMDNLSPTSQYVKTSITLPLRKGLKIHSIIGNLKGLALSNPECSDGVVPYTSSHLKNVTSELVVPYGHSAHEHPNAIKEIHRIMLLHLKEMR